MGLIQGHSFLLLQGRGSWRPLLHPSPGPPGPRLCSFWGLRTRRTRLDGASDAPPSPPNLSAPVQPPECHGPPRTSRLPKNHRNAPNPGGRNRRPRDLGGAGHGRGSSGGALAGIGGGLDTLYQPRLPAASPDVRAEHVRAERGSGPGRLAGVCWWRADEGE